MNKISGKYNAKLHRLIFNEFIIENKKKIQLYYFKSNFTIDDVNITTPKLVNILMKDVGYMSNIHVRDEQDKIIDTLYMHDYPNDIYIYDNYKDLKDGYNNEIYDFINFLKYKIKHLKNDNTALYKIKMEELQNRVNDYKNKFIDTDYLMEKMIRGD